MFYKKLKKEVKGEQQISLNKAKMSDLNKLKKIIISVVIIFFTEGQEEGKTAGKEKCECNSLTVVLDN